MAKLERTLAVDFDELLDYLHGGILKGSISASWEDGSDYDGLNFRCAVRVYERYSLLGGNRVSLNLTLVGEGDRVFVSAITAGGSQAVFDKMNTVGEAAFLDKVEELLESCRPAAPSRPGAGKPYPCPCCGNYTMEEEPGGSYQTCPVCAWVDDPWALEHPDEPGGCNTVTLEQARENYRACGACSPELRGHVRPPEPEEELGIQ
ncbi:MAG: DUF6054 family protein [Flavonifractor plautii]